MPFCPTLLRQVWQMYCWYVDTHCPNRVIKHIQTRDRKLTAHPTGLVGTSHYENAHQEDVVLETVYAQRRGQRNFLGASASEAPPLLASCICQDGSGQRTSYIG